MNAPRVLACLIIAFCSGMVRADDRSSNETMYRADQPAVLKAGVDAYVKKTQDEARLIGNFRTSYERAERPKFLMMWHRELSDNINSNKEINGTVTSTGLAARNNYQQIIKVQWKDGSERAVSLLPPARGAEFESGFQQTLRNAGVKLVDRNTAIRMTALDKVKKGGNENDFNFQTIEARALETYAGYFIEVRFIPNPEAKGGTEPRVTVISSSTGEILVDVVPSTLYKNDGGTTSWSASNEGFIKSADGAADGEWKTDSKGFVKQPRKRGGQEEGRAVALAIMQSLAEVWGSAAK